MQLSLFFHNHRHTSGETFINFPGPEQSGPSKTELVGADGVPVCPTLCS